MPIETILSEYKNNVDKWALVADFVDENVIRLAKNLRTIDEDDRSIDNTNRNKEYRDGAVLINVTKRTHDGMVGAVFRKPPTVELPATLEYAESDVNGTGVGLEQFSKKVLSNTMQTGRTGILTDFPAAIEGATVEESRGRTARLIEYSTEKIINWRTTDGKLSLVVLCETYEFNIDDFEVEDKEQFRELRLLDGVYIQRVWRDGMIYSEQVITDFTGRPLDEITFTFVGTLNNDTKIDPSLLYSIAAINKGHYRNSADLEENCFVHGQLTLGITSDLDAEAWKSTNPNGVKVGARKGHYLGAAGGFHSVQALPNTLADNLMTKKEDQMVMIGARVIKQTGSNEREASVLSRIGAETATLSSLARNVSTAIEKSLLWADGYMSGSPQESIFDLNQDFYPKSFDAQQVMGLIQLYDRGRIAAYDLHQNLQQASIIGDDRDLDTVDAEAEDISPLQTTATTAPFQAE